MCPGKMLSEIYNSFKCKRKRAVYTSENSHNYSVMLKFSTRLKGKKVNAAK